MQKLYARVPLAQRAVRTIGSSILELIMVAGVLKYRRTKLLNRSVEKMALRHLERQVEDPETRKKLTPDYTFGCKRPTFSNTYFPTFNRDNVHLETTPIARIEPDGIVTADGTKTQIDTLVLATGFNLWDTNFPAFEIIGRDGKDLGKFWRDQQFQAYEGVTVPGFPNFISLNSPYSYSGLSYFTTIESQMRHMKRLLGEVAEAARDDVRGHGAGQRGVPRPDDRSRRGLGVRQRQLRDVAVVLLQPARHGDAAAPDLDAQRLPRSRQVPARRLRVRLSQPAVASLAPARGTSSARVVVSIS